MVTLHDRRVVVIGAGHTGLMAAIHLARAGLEVTVLEHAPYLGGASSSHETTLPGFLHDHCAGYNPMTVASPAFRELDLESRGLAWVTPEAVMAHPFEDGSAITLHRDVAETAASLDAVHPGAGAAWEAVTAELLPVTDQLVAAVLGPLAPTGAPIHVVRALGGLSVTLARRMLGSIQALGFDVFDRAERPTAWMAGSAQHSGLPPSTAGSGAFGLLLQLVGHVHGWPFPRGGQQRIPDLMAELAREAGATVRLGAHVDRIDVRNDRVCGVTLASGEQLPARAVLSTISARPLLELLPAGALPDRLTMRLRRWRYGTAAFKIDYALSGPIPWTAEAPRRASVVHVAGELNDLAGAAQAGLRGEVPERPALVVGQQSLDDPSRAPAGQQSLYCYAHVPARYTCSDAEIADRIDAQFERFAPGFGERVLARTIRNPRQTEADNPSLVDGDLGGGLMELDQMLIFRPAPEMCRHRTPLKGLYVSGASVHPAGSVQGMGGRSAARALLADRRIRPWRA